MPPPRGGMAGRGRGRGGRVMNHRPTRSQEEAMRARRMQGGNGHSRPGPSDSPQRRQGRLRRNSDSSLMESDKPLTEEEKKAREARRRERERRYREAKEKDKTKPTGRRLDIIDQLDATSIFGTGRKSPIIHFLAHHGTLQKKKRISELILSKVFHHDGPFDALNPHRNRKGSRRAPMQAFPQGSLNNSLGGSGPLNARPDHATFMGNADPEAFKEYSTGAVDKSNFPADAKSEMGVFDPMSRGSILHGDESLGLGTSTFLEGAPAARTAIQRREQEQAQQDMEGGLQRKKSLAQRIRNINKVPREFNASGRMTNPEATYGSRRSPDAMPPATSIPSLGGEKNPFFNEFSKEPENISVKRADTGPISPTSPTTSSSRRYSGGGGIERRQTSDASSPTNEDGANKSSGGGLLARVKSLKGGRKPRQNDAPTNPPPPGTAV
jgi:hypothetical protein